MHPAKPGGRGAGISMLLPTCLFLLTAIGTTAGHAAEQDYLESINSEAEKVETRRLKIRADADNPDSAAIQLPASAPEAKRAGATRQSFESYLEGESRGLFAFYTKLTQRSKEEVYERYINGADMEILREKVMTRYQHETPKAGPDQPTGERR